MFKKPLLSFALISVLLVAACGSKAGLEAAEKIAPSLEKASLNFQPLRNIDNDLTDLGRQGVKQSDEWRKATQEIIDQLSQEGVKARIEGQVGLTNQLNLLMEEIARQINDAAKNAKVGLDDATFLSQISGLIAVLNRGIQVGVDEKTIAFGEKLIKELATQPDRWQTAIGEVTENIKDDASEAAKNIKQELVDLRKSAADQANLLVRNVGAEGRCNADFMSQKALTTVQSVVGRGIIGEVIVPQDLRSAS